MIQFQREKITKELFEESLPLLKRHYEEIAQFKDIPLEVDINQYVLLDEAKITRLFTARKNGALVGYANYFVRKHPHFNSSVQALSDVLYIDSSYRGFGMSFLRFCEVELTKEGVEQVYQSVNPEHDFGKLLERCGYVKADIQYSKKLGG